MIPTPATPVVKRLPGVIDATHLIAMLFGADTTCKSRKIPLKPDECAIVASYRDNEGALKRLLACDLAFANSAGSALTAIPPAAASKETKAGKVPDNVLENLIEVMNVADNLFTESFGGRLELVSVTRLCDVSPDIRAALAAETRVKLDIVIPRYEAGRVDLIAV